MKTICAPSQVMREGNDLNQHGQAGRQEQASSSSPLTFHGVFLAAASPVLALPKAVRPHRIAIGTIDLLERILFISFFLSLKFSILFCSANVIARSGWSIRKRNLKRSQK